MYKRFLNSITQEALRTYETIIAEYNFEYGNEFEFAICQFLRTFLPKKYSICRGYIVDKNDQTAGDDIIIYDANLFPKLRISDDNYTIKQSIPFEAVYAYIEAKHTLDQRTLSKAFKQVGAAKNLKRDARLVTETDFCNFQPGQIIPAEDWPEYRNPIYGCIISRNIANNDDMTCDVLRSYITEAGQSCAIPPDLILAGNKFICLPSLDERPGMPPRIESPFFIPNKSKLAVYESEMSIGTGMCTLLLALNFIILKQINYKYLIAEGLGLGMLI